MIVKFNLEIWQTYDICAALPCQNLGQENVVFQGKRILKMASQLLSN